MAKLWALPSNYFWLVLLVCVAISAIYASPKYVPRRPDSPTAGRLIGYYFSFATGLVGAVVVALSAIVFALASLTIRGGLLDTLPFIMVFVASVVCICRHVRRLTPRRVIRLVLHVARGLLLTFRGALTALHRSTIVLRSGARHLALRAIGKASRPALWALGAFAIAMWFCDYKVGIFDEISFVLGKLPFILGRAVLGRTLNGIQDAFFMPSPHGDGAAGDTMPEKVWVFVNLARVLALASVLLLLWGAALLAASVLLGIVGWLAGVIARLLGGGSGGARFASWWNVARLRDRRGIVFGHYAGSPLPLYTDKHVLIMASTRSGKGVSLIIPHLLRYPASAFVLDPKGENARATGRRRAKLNDQVHYLDPFGISGKPKSRFNPLARFTPKNMEAESKALAAALFVSKERDHWTASGQQLLAAFIMYVFASDDVVPEDKDLNYVRRLLLGSAPETLAAMKKSKVADGLVASLATSFLNTPENERGSIISSAQRETEILDNPDIAACLAAAGDTPEVDFSAWHRQTMTVYLCLSAPKFPTFNRWLRLVLTSALDEMTDRLNPPPLPTCFMLDELATLGHFEPVENAIGLAAGYGVQLFTVFQDVAQMKDLYKGRWASFIGNAGIRAVFNLDDYDTAHYWSDFLGGRVTGTMSRSQDIYGITQGYNAGETMQPLGTAEELMRRYTAGKMLVLPQGARPIEADRVPYFDDPELVGLWDDPRGALPLPMPMPATAPHALPQAA